MEGEKYRRDSVVRFHTRYAFFIGLVFSALMLVFTFLLAKQYNLHTSHEKSLLENNFLERVRHLDNMLNSVAMLVRSMQVAAETDLREALQPENLVPPPAFRGLADAPEEQRYHLDEILPPLQRETVGNLTGEGSIRNRSRDFYREIHMALRLNRHFFAVSQALKNIAWIYYTSAGGFINIYPWVSSNDFHFSRELYSHGFYILGLPENNPARDLFWTEVYVDEYGKGLMTTCAAPVYDNERFLGTIAIDLTVDFLNTTVKEFREKDGVMFVVNEYGQIVAHPSLVTSRDPRTRNIKEALPSFLKQIEDPLHYVQDHGITRIGSWAVMKSLMKSAPWHVVYMEPVRSIWASFSERFGIGTVGILLVIPLLVISVLVVTHKHFVLPAEQFGVHVMGRSRCPTSLPARKVPRHWQVWFDAVDRAFSENDALNAEIERKNDELEAKVEERTAKMMESNRQLRKEIAERKQAQEAMKTSERRLTDIISFLPDATFVIDKEGKIVAWNRAIEDLTGIKAEEMVGKDNYEYAIPFYGTRRPMLIDLVLHGDAEIEAQYASFERLWDAAFCETCGTFLKEGMWLWGAARVLRDSCNNMVGAIQSIRDISARKRMEEERLRREKLQGVLEMAGAVCHELNQPMQVVLGYSELLRMNLPDEKILPTDIETIREQIVRMGETTKKLMKITGYETTDYLGDGKIVDIEKSSDKKEETHAE